MIPKDHPRYRSLVARERLARCAREGIVAMEGLAAHGRGEAFDYLIGEKTTKSAALAARTAAAILLSARHAVISVNGNTAALAADEIAALQRASGADVEVNLFHRTEERMALITRLLTEHGVRVLSGTPERLVPLSHDRALCLPEGIGDADVVLVPLEDGDRCAALRAMGKTVITIDLNPLSRTARTATLTVVDEVTRAIPAITAACSSLGPGEGERLVASLDNTYLLRAAIDEMRERLAHALE
ncbi:MAG: phosphopantothenate/pantothenate synthetase [Methanomicrobiales archaeon HGW-Methanomicrobiales-2]|nr:MAG: phosphopantothenate/pantothenate synthetase [Methanomicrobiales archaeon HGW-Methanomicrobiales-2]